MATPAGFSSPPLPPPLLSPSLSLSLISGGPFLEFNVFYCTRWGAWERKGGALGMGFVSPFPSFTKVRFSCLRRRLRALGWGLAAQLWLVLRPGSPPPAPGSRHGHSQAKWSWGGGAGSPGVLQPPRKAFREGGCRCGSYRAWQGAARSEEEPIGSQEWRANGVDVGVRGSVTGVRPRHSAYPPPRAGPWESAGRDRGGGGHSGDGQSRTGPRKCASSWLAMATDQVGWRSNQNHRQKNPNCTKARRLARAGGGPGGLPGGAHGSHSPPPPP